MAPRPALLLAALMACAAALRAPAVHRVSRRAILGAAAASFAGSPTVSQASGGGGSSNKEFERSVASAFAAVTKGDYAASERLWAQITEKFPVRGSWHARTY